MNEQEKLGLQLDQLLTQIESIGGAETLDNINKGLKVIEVLKAKLELVRKMGANTNNVEDKLNDSMRKLLTAKSVLEQQ